MDNQASVASIGIDQIKSVDQIMQQVAEHKGCGTSGEGGKASCGSSGGPEDMDPAIWEKVKVVKTKVCHWGSPPCHFAKPSPKEIRPMRTPTHIMWRPMPRLKKFSSGG